MMKIVKFFIIFLYLMPLVALENNLAPNLSNIKDPTQLINDEIHRLDHLIVATKQSLDIQNKLKEQIIDYQKIQNVYLENTKDNELLYQMIKAAHQILESIKENHLVQNFDPQFLSELTLLSQIAEKCGISKL